MRFIYVCIHKYRYRYIHLDVQIYIHIYTKIFYMNTHRQHTCTHTHASRAHSHVSVPSLFCSCLSFSQLSTVVTRCWEQPGTPGFLTRLEQSPRLLKKPKDDNGRYILVHTHTQTHLPTSLLMELALVTWKQHGE